MEDHRIRHPTVNTVGSKAERVISHFSSTVGTKRTATNITVMSSAGISQTEDKLVVTLAVKAPPWFTVAPSIFVTAVTSCIFMGTVGIAVSPDLQLVIAQTL